MQEAYEPSRLNAALLSASLPLSHSFAPTFLDPSIAHPGSVQALSSLPAIAFAGQWPQSASNILARYAHLADLQKLQQDHPADTALQLQANRKRPPTQELQDTGFAVRHKTAEKRRRARINDQLDELRKMVPHQASATRVAFLEDVVKYVVVLQQRNSELEAAFSGLQSQLGLTQMISPRPAELGEPTRLMLTQYAEAQQMELPVPQKHAGPVPHKKASSTEQSADWSPEFNSQGNSPSGSAQ